LLFRLIFPIFISVRHLDLPRALLQNPQEDEPTASSPFKQLYQNEGVGIRLF